jgi:hypothetical protein
MPLTQQMSPPAAFAWSLEGSGGHTRKSEDPTLAAAKRMIEKSVLLRGERFARRFERSPWVAPILGCVYVAMVWLPVQRRFWHDELFTFYIAGAPSLQRLFDQIRHIDLNPPMLYLVTRAAQQAFGPNEVATRLPSVCAFFGASVLVAGFLAPRVGLLWAWASVVLFWWSDFFLYSTEARPYSLLLFFFALTLFSRDSARRSSRKSWWIVGVFAGSCGMFLTHVLAPFTLLAFAAAELVRLLKWRVADWRMWIALFAPSAIFAFHLFLIRDVTGGAFPVAFQASVSKTARFYGGLFLNACLLLGIAALVAFAFQRWRESIDSQPDRFTAEDIGLLTILAVSPVLVNATLMRSHGPFFDRYCITSALALLSGAVLLIGRAAHFGRLAGLTVLALFTGSCFATKYLEPLAHLQAATPFTSKLESINPDLPVVMASGLTFLEIDHYSEGRFLARVYYLTDRESALKYAHADMFEGLPGVKRYLPVRAQVIPYQSFVAQHRRFLVLGTVNYPEDWLLRKLIAERVPLRRVGIFRIPYKDKSLYLVDFDGRPPG